MVKQKKPDYILIETTGEESWRVEACRVFLSEPLSCYHKPCLTK